jgi:hypothetical protein
MFRPYDPESDGQLGDGKKTGLSVSPPANVSAICWELPLGQPVISMTIDQSEDKAFVENARTVLAQYIHMDSRNAVAKITGLRQIYWPRRVRTNSELKETGIWVQWINALTPYTEFQLRSLAPLVATLIRTYESVNDGEMVDKLGALLDILPQDQDLKLVRDIIKDGIEMQKKKRDTGAEGTPQGP